METLDDLRTLLFPKNEPEILVTFFSPIALAVAAAYEFVGAEVFKEIRELTRKEKRRDGYQIISFGVNDLWKLRTSYTLPTATFYVSDDHNLRMRNLLPRYASIATVVTFFNERAFEATKSTIKLDLVDRRGNFISYPDRLRRAEGYAMLRPTDTYNQLTAMSFDPFTEIDELMLGILPWFAGNINRGNVRAPQRCHPQQGLH